MSNTQISIIVPLYNEEESLPELEAWISRVMQANKFSYEILFIDDGSNDNSWAVIQQLAQANTAVKGIQFRRNYGKSAALNVGFADAVGDVVITMDADLQDSPDEIPILYNRIINEKLDLISGWKKKRYDPISKTLPTKLFNWATRKMSGIYLHDFNCGLKAYNSQVTKNIEVYGEMHRYIPVIAKSAGFNKISEQIVEHRARKYGSSKFGLNRFVNGLLDLLTIFFMGKFGKKPMHFFGVYGLICFIIGFFIAFYMLISKLIHIINKEPAPLVSDSPFFYIGLFIMIIGTQLFLAGFLGELISRNSNDRNQYAIANRVGNNNG